MMKKAPELDLTKYIVRNTTRRDKSKYSYSGPHPRVFGCRQIWRVLFGAAIMLAWLYIIAVCLLCF